MYCEGYLGFCPSWINGYGDNPKVQARKAGQAMTGQRNPRDDASSVTRVAGFAPAPLTELTPDASAAAITPGDRATRAGQVLDILRSELPRLTLGFTPTIHETRQADADTVEIIYSYPGIDGLIGLRRDVSVQSVDLAPGDREFALAANENNPHEIATMLRVALEEPPPIDLLVPDESGVAWWGSPAGD